VRSRQLLRSLPLLACVFCVIGCHPSANTRTATWPNSQLRAKETYYMDSSGTRVFHGVSTYWDAEGALVAEGVWRHGKAWEGVCWIPVAGDAGSVGGLGCFERYRMGKSVGKVPGRP